MAVQLGVHLGALDTGYVVSLQANLLWDKTRASLYL